MIYIRNTETPKPSKQNVGHETKHSSLTIQKLNMPCLVITGYPSSGKTSIAQALSERALKHRSQSIKKTVIINEESIFSSSSALSQQNTAGKANETRYYCYKDSNAEKQTRSALKTEFDKQAATASSTNTLVILDSLNYIKGYRYELHCISKAAGERHGILWVVCPPGVALEWNKKRIQEDLEKPKEGNANESNDDDEKQHRLYYSEEMMEGLMKRYEPPDQRNRWDKPLYRVELAALLPELASSSSTQTESNGNDSTANTIAKDVLAKSVYNMHSLSDAIDKSSPTEKQTKQKLPSSSNESNGDKDRTPLEVKLDEILDAFLESRPLKEGMSTQKPVVAESNVSTISK